MRITNRQFSPMPNVFGSVSVGGMTPIVTKPIAAAPVRWNWTSEPTAAVVLLQAHLLGIIPADEAGFNAILDKFFKAIAEETSVNSGYPQSGSVISDNGLVVSIDTFDFANNKLQLSVALDQQSLAHMSLTDLYQPTIDHIFGGGFETNDAATKPTFLESALPLIEPGGPYAATRTTYGLRVNPVEVQPGPPNIIATVKLCGEDGETVGTVTVPFFATNLAVAATNIPASGVDAEALRLGIEYDDYAIDGVRYMTAEERQQYAVKSE